MWGNKEPNGFDGEILAKAEFFGGPLDGRQMNLPRTDPAYKKSIIPYGKDELIGYLPTKDVRIDWLGMLERYTRVGLVNVSDVYRYDWWDEVA
jgi:hypothetical protein